MSVIGQPSLAPSPSPQVLESITGAANSPASNNSATLQPTEPVRRASERLALTQRAHQVMRIHLVRSAIRMTVLMTGDAAALLVLRALLRGVRDEQWLGSAAASLMHRLAPEGALP